MVIKKYLKIVCFVISISVFLLLLSGCQKKESISNTELADIPEHDIIAGTTYMYADSGTFYGKCYTENGYYEIQNGFINFVSYDTGDRYVVCSRLNCKHKDENCAAWVNNSSGTLGLARYKNHMYIMNYNGLEHNSYTLRSSDFDGENQKDIITFSCGDQKQDGWHIASIDEVYYCNNIAWCKVMYDYTENGEWIDACNQLIGYRLDTGDKIELTQLQQDYCEVDDPFSYLSISEEKIVIMDYSDMSILIYDIESQTMSRYTELQMQEALEKLGEDMSNYPAVDFRFIGYVEETGLYYFQMFGYSDSTKETNTKNIIFSWDLENNGDILTDFEAGGTIFQMIGYIKTVIVDDTEILYSKELNDDRSMIYRLNLITGESKQLFEDDSHITFRILYDGQGFYIGTLDEGNRLCKISKDDFDSGNISAAQTISKLSNF